MAADVRAREAELSTPTQAEEVAVIKIVFRLGGKKGIFFAA
jgi:hypothetical protein